MADDPYSIFSSGVTAAPASTEQAPADEYSIFQAGGVKPATPTETPEVVSPQAVAASKKLGDFRARSIASLASDKSFDPVAAYASKEFGDDDDAMKKLIDVFKTRETGGVDVGALATGVAKGLGHLPSAVAEGAGSVASDVVNAGEGVANGNKDRTASALGNLGAGVHTNLAGLLTTIDNAGERALRAVSSPRSDNYWKYEIQRVAENRKLVSDAAHGDVGGIREATERAGGTVDAATAQAESTVLDPTLLIPVLAGGKAVRAAGAVADAIEAGGAAGRATEAVAAAGRGAIPKAADAVLTAGKDAAATVFDKAGTALETGGKALEKAKGGPIGGLVGTAAGAAFGGIPGAVAGASGFLAPKAIKTAGGALTRTAAQLRGTVPPGPIWEAISAVGGNKVVKGLATGAAGGLGLTGDPLALAFSALGAAGAENSEQAGEALGGQAGFGAAAGGFHGTAKTLEPFFDIAGQVYDPKTASTPVNSPAYGTAPEIDAVHQTAIANLNPAAQARINQFREAVRSRGAEIYVLDPDNFGGAVADYFRQHGEQTGNPLTPEQLESIRDSSSGAANAKGLFVENFDYGNGTKKKVVFLNSDGGALQHEGGHLIESFLPEDQRKALAAEVSKRYGEDELSKFRQAYEERLGQKISHSDLIDEVIAENISAVLNAVPVEQLGTPKPVARAIYQALGKTFETLGVVTERKTDLGLRPDFGLGQLAENVLRAQESAARPVIKEVGKVDLTKVDLREKQPAGAKPPLPPTGSKPSAADAADFGPDNIRVSREDQNRFQRQKSDEALAAASKAVDANPNYGPEQKAAFVKLGAVIAQGGDRPRPVEVNYNAAKSKEFQAGRGTRRTEQMDTYVKEATDALPENVRQLTQKVLIPERFEVRSDDNVQLVAKSLDKVVANAYILAKEANKNGVANLVPYANKEGALTNSGWQSLVEDIQRYTANQSNGYAGDGRAVNVPKDYLGVIPTQNPNFKPIAVNKNAADFINMLMALPPPATGRKGASLSGKDVNAIARPLAEANAKIPLESVTSSDPEGKFRQRNGVDIAEFNPLRDQMARAGVKVRDLIEVTERINLKNIEGEVKVRNDLDFSRPSTDLIRAGFMPDPKKAPRVGNSDVRSVAEDYAKSAGLDYDPFKGYAKLSPELATRIADWYDGVKSAPNDPVTRIAYDSLAEQLKGQYQKMVDAGYSIEPWTGKGEPYHSSADMVADVKKNKHLWFFPTENGFGSREHDVASNPMLKSADVEINGLPLVVNDLFRAVHDFFGHSKEGYEFGPRGEYNAFLAHSTMFSPEALPALAAETLAQNAWVNNGQHLRRADGTLPARGDADFIDPKNRPFADQKVVAVPQDLLNEALAGRSEKANTHPEKIASVEAALKDKDTKFQVSVFHKDDVPAGKSRIMQVDMLSPNAAGSNYGSVSPSLLKEYGMSIPEPTDSLPHGRYSIDELKAAAQKEPAVAGKFKPAISEKNQPLVDAVGGKPLRIIHLSGASGLTELSVKKFGKGMATPTDLRGAPKIFFFEEGSKVGADSFWTKGRQAYGAEVDGSKIYDAVTDSLDWAGTPNREKADNMLRDAGYDGLRVETNDGRKVVALFKDTPVTPLGKFKAGAKIEIPEGKFMPGDIYLGEVLDDGEVKSKRGSATDSHEKLGFKNGVRWRYSPETEKVYFWSHEKPTEVQRESIAASLERRGMSVAGTESLDVNDWKNFDRVYNEAHGATAEDLANGELRPKKSKSLDTADLRAR